MSVMESPTMIARAGSPPTRRARLSVERLSGDGAECFQCHSEMDPLHLEQPLILLQQRVLRMGQNELQRGLGRSSNVARLLPGYFTFMHTHRYATRSSAASLTVTP
jgi:hypothetical protein